MKYHSLTVCKVVHTPRASCYMEHLELYSLGGYPATHPRCGTPTVWCLEPWLPVQKCPGSAKPSFHQNRVSMGIGFPAKNRWSKFMGFSLCCLVSGTPLIFQVNCRVQSLPRPILHLRIHPLHSQRVAGCTQCACAAALRGVDASQGDDRHSVVSLRSQT